MIRVPEEILEEARVVARVLDMSLNGLIVAALAAEIARAQREPSFVLRAQQLADTDQAVIDRLIAR